MKVLLYLLLAAACGAQSFVAVTAVSQDGITTSIPIDNRSLVIRHSNVHTFCATGTGTWSAQAQYSDTSVSGSWISFTDSTSLITNNSASCIGYALGYHPFIRFLFVGTSSVSYRGIKDIYIPPPSSGGGGVSFPTLGGGTNTTGTFTLGSGATMTFSGSGINNANRFNGVNVGALSTGLVKNTAGIFSIAAGGTDYELPLTVSSPICRSVNALSICAASINLSHLSGSVLSGNGAKLATATGTLTSGDAAQIDASGNYIASGLQVSAIIRSTATYADPAWITSLASTKLTGTIPNGILGSNVVRTDQSNTYSAGTQDFGSAAHTFPSKRGLLSAIPGSCSTGEEYFATDAPVGTNKYLCISGAWVQQAGGGTGTSQVCPAIRSSSTVITVAVTATSTAPCILNGQSFVSPVTATVSSGTGIVYGYAQGSSIIVGYGTGFSNGNVVCSGCTATFGITGFPNTADGGTVPIFTWTATSGIWDISGGSKKLGEANAVSFTAGPNVTLTTGANSLNIAMDLTIPQASHSADYTLVLADANGESLHPTADNNPRTFTIPSNASVPYPIGTILLFTNQINTLTIAITTDTIQIAGTATTGTRTLSAAGMATFKKITSTLWYATGPGLN